MGGEPQPHGGGPSGDGHPLGARRLSGKTGCAGALRRSAIIRARCRLLNRTLCRYILLFILILVSGFVFSMFSASFFKNACSRPFVFNMFSASFLLSLCQYLGTKSRNEILGRGAGKTASSRLFCRNARAGTILAQPHGDRPCCALRAQGTLFRWPTACLYRRHSSSRSIAYSFFFVK